MSKYSFGPFSFDTDRFELTRNGSPKQLSPRLFSVLRVLIENRHRVVTKAELMATVWRDSFVEEENVGKAVSNLRLILDDRNGQQKYIRTVSGIGYQFIHKLNSESSNLSGVPVDSISQPNQALPTAKSAVIVGRSGEFAIFENALKDAARNRSSILCISGEAGIGKTALVEKFTGSLDSNVFVVHSRCAPWITASEPYAPFVDVFAALRVQCTDTHLQESMKRVAPAWYAQAVPGECDGAPFEVNPSGPLPDSMRRQFVAALREFSKHKPVLLFIDDFHWSDNASVDLVGYLTSQLSGLRLLLILAFRATELLVSGHSFGDMKQELQAKDLCSQIILRSLREDEISEYLSTAFRWDSYPQGLGSFIFRQTEGNPLFMIHFLAYLKTEGLLRETDTGWQVAGNLEEIVVQLPPSIENLLDRKIGKLGSEDRFLIGIASVQGLEFDSAILAGVSQMKSEDVEERLLRMVRVHELITHVGQREAAGGQISQRYRFVHALFHKAIRDSLVPSRKAVVSLQVAHSLQENRTEEPTRLSTQLAILYEAGRDYWRASEHLLASARAALRRSANREAIEICTKGLELISNVAGVNKDERELLLTLAKGTAELGLKGFGAAEVRQTFEKARTLCRRQDATEGLAILHGLWMSYLSQTHLHTCLSLAGEILVITKDDPDNEVRAMGYYTLAITQFQMGDAASAIPNFGRAIELYGTPSIERAVRYSFDTRIMAQMELAIAYQWTGCFAQAEALMQEAIATAKPLNHTPTDAIAAGFASGILVHLEQYGEAQRLAHYTNDLCERHALPHWKYVAQFYEGVALASLGDTTAGLKLMRAAIDGMDQIGSHLSRPTFAGFMADILVRIGTCEEALSLIDGQLKRVAHTGEHYYDSRLLTLKGAALLLLGNNNGEKILLEGIDVARKQQFRFFELIGVMTLSAHLAKTGRHSDARATLQPVYDSFSEDSHTPVLQRARTMLHDLN